MKPGLPVYDAVVLDGEDGKGDELGLTALSLVDKPAIGVNFLRFSAAKVVLKVEHDTGTGRRVTGPILIPGKLIYRVHPETGKEYYLRYTPDAIEKTLQLLAKRGGDIEINLDHQTGRPIKAVRYETWMKRKPGQDPIGNFDLPVGTAFATVLIEDEQAIKDIDEGRANGFSIEGLYLEAPAGIVKQELQLKKTLPSPNQNAKTAKPNLPLMKVNWKNIFGPLGARLVKLGATEQEAQADIEKMAQAAEAELASAKKTYHVKQGDTTLELEMEGETMVVVDPETGEQIGVMAYSPMEPETPMLAETPPADAPAEDKDKPPGEGTGGTTDLNKTTTLMQAQIQKLEAEKAEADKAAKLAQAELRAVQLAKANALRGKGTPPPGAGEGNRNPEVAANPVKLSLEEQKANLKESSELANKLQ